jgi:hypothetical protein
MVRLRYSRANILTSGIPASPINTQDKRPGFLIFVSLIKLIKLSADSKSERPEATMNR